ncbi:hypothetical protein [Brevibacillus fulvus]|uniref:Uncharacterized protein n=1 Tax=Brevibacillus fulvus TaxID=1125967 RepID=A0A938Y209_9BACL|nr:hypothetical protein [Brevibacillus fulvus]MBM7591866.1 hypothetical protein [Brevibacillus fulvus]
MGVPVTSYTILRALADNEPKSYEYDMAKMAFEPFDVFAFFIHDPVQNRQFHQKMTGDFYRFHSMTGKNLCFFALVNPPDIWEQRAVHREHVHFFRTWESDTLSAAKQSLTASSLAEALDIPAEQLPVLVITNNFQLKSFYWVQTCAEHVTEQFARLTAVANEFQEQFAYSVNEGKTAEAQRILFQMLDDAGLNLCNGYGKESLYQNMAAALSDIMDFIAVSDRQIDAYVRKKAERKVNDTLHRLLAELNSLKQKMPQDVGDAEEREEFLQLESLSLKISKYIALMKKKTDTEDLFHFEHVLESDTLEILRIGLQVTDYLSQYTSLKPTQMNRFDFTPGLICLTKVFEKEINLSVVQWLRKIYGITLPQYYNRYQPDRQVIVAPQIPDGKPIDLNQPAGPVQWRAPGIGQSELIARFNIKADNLPPDWSLQHWSYLLDRWKKTARYRNRAAHTELVTLDETHEVKNILLDLHKSGIFQKMAALKKLARE